MERYVFTPEKRSALESLRQPFAVFQFLDKRVVTILLSDGFCELFGYSDRTEAVYDMDYDMYKDTHPDDSARIANAAIRFALNGGRYDVIYRTRKKNGSGYTIVHAIGEHVYTEDGTRLAQVWYTDEGAYVEESALPDGEISKTLSNAIHEQSILNAGHYDFLTGLPNMTYFFELAEAGKDTIRKKGGWPTILYIDFSGMKFFNTKHGFAQGDKMIQAFARILIDTFSKGNCCRIGGDHFSVITEKIDLEKKLQGIFREFEGVFDGKTPPVHVGIFPYSYEDVPVSTACDRAKFACSLLKGSYASDFNYYNAELREDRILKQYVIENIDTAIREKWIEVYLQPIIRAVNGKVCDVEALSRWNDPDRGVLSPASFIPALEEAGLIYKLDLYMVEQVLEMIHIQMKENFFIVPHSINLSRSDFETCDIVEEIRKRVDAAGIDRDRITIEITESIIGSNFEFMMEQVQRFHNLGFPVWMDDFGSGYSSLDVLQNIKFDLIKFDMSFLRRLDEGEDGKIILSELMRMAIALGVDTVCEGVETESQIRFLKEIGCSKLQGYYFSKPIPLETIQRLKKSGQLIENENTEESDYFESISRVNLFDLGVIASEEKDELQNTFHTIPIAVLEVNKDMARYVRSNRSYQDFMKRFFGIDVLKELSEFDSFSKIYGYTFRSVVKQCCSSGTSAFFDEKMRDGSVVHSFVRRINENPVTGNIAVAIAVLSISSPDDSTTYADIARALATDYYSLYVIDLDTEDYTEYVSRAGGEELSIKHRGKNFFETAGRESILHVYEEDRETFLALFTKENILRNLDTQSVFATTCRLMEAGKPMYVNIKISRLQGRNRIILGINNIDAQMKQQEEERKLQMENERLKKEAAVNQKIAALQESVSSLLANMPGMTFSKEVNTGRYLACNQHFAEYANKETPEGVVGLTDYEIFDPETALHFVEDDKKALGMDVPYVFFEEVLDPAGNERQFQTTKLKYTDTNDRQCLLGLSLDVTDAVRMKREYTSTKLAYEKTRNTATIYTHLAHALARGYTDLFYVNMDTDEFIEFHTDDKLGVLSEARFGTDFFEGCERDAVLYVQPEDQKAFVTAMNRDFLRNVLDQSRVYELIYRRIKEGRVFYVKMKVSRMEDDDRILVIAVSDIDELMRQRRVEEQIQEERIVYARLHALTGNFICVYMVDPETNAYREFSATANYEENFAQKKEGSDFFESVREAGHQYICREDLKHFLTVFTKENVMEEVKNGGIFTLGYRLMMKGRPVHIQMKAVMVEEKEGPRLIIGLNDIDLQVRREEEKERRLAQAQSQVNIDALTGVKNRHAFLEMETRIDRQIVEHRQSPFALVIFDVNNLKTVNDSLGHQAGDQYLRDACKIICDIFKHSPVFRVGGDEFAVISQDKDYKRIEKLVERMAEHNQEASRTGGIVIACGMSKYDNDSCVAEVFERADQEMYKNKYSLKNAK